MRPRVDLLSTGRYLQHTFVCCYVGSVLELGGLFLLPHYLSRARQSLKQIPS
jgi:hypothetical protein